MEKTTPVEELNIERIANSIKRNQEKIEEAARRKYKKELDGLNLYSIVNRHKIYLFPFSYLLDRLNDLKKDNDAYSLEVKEDIVEQLSKMKEVPDFNTICHIESTKINKNSSIIQFVRKLFIRPKRYKLIFHNKNIDLNKEHNTLCGKEFLVIFGILISCCMLGRVASIDFLFCFSIVSILIIFCVFMLFFMY